MALTSRISLTLHPGYLLISKNLELANKAVVPAEPALVRDYLGNVGNQIPRIAQTYHIHVLWMPAIHADKTDLLKLLANQETEFTYNPLQLTMLIY